MSRILIYCDRHPDRPTVRIAAFTLATLDDGTTRWNLEEQESQRRLKNPARLKKPQHVNLLDVPEQSRPVVYRDSMRNRDDLAEVWDTMRPLHELTCGLCRKQGLGKLTVSLKPETLDGVLDEIARRDADRISLSQLAGMVAGNDN